MTDKEDVKTASQEVRRPSIWLASSLSKQRGEAFFLQWSVIWICAIAYVVLTEIYETFTDFQYLLFGFFIGLPPILLPLLSPSYCDDPSVPLTKRYTTKANIWIAIYSFIGNYVCTHYFYTVLGVQFTFLENSSQRWNDVPILFYFMTHSYFLLYHVSATILLRGVSHQSSGQTRYLIMAVTVFVSAYVIAFMEVFTIQSFPYYAYPDKTLMFKIGSLFYALYFFVSFPAFYRLDEYAERGDIWTVGRTVWDSLATCMLVILLLEAWRVLLGPMIVMEVGDQNIGLPWMKS